MYFKRKCALPERKKPSNYASLILAECVQRYFLHTIACIDGAEVNEMAKQNKTALFARSRVRRDDAPAFCIAPGPIVESPGRSLSCV